MSGWNLKGNKRACSFNSRQKAGEDLHPVTNPAFDPDDKSLFVTRSGSRGDLAGISV